MTHWLQSAAAVVFTFGLVIFLHELGHFLLCRLLRVRVERFAFGFGPELVGVTHNGTRLSLCAFPLGGFVKPAGDNLEDCTGQEDEYFSKSWAQRLAIVAAGPGMNYILAFLLFFGLIWAKGLPEPTSEPVIGETAAGFPAEAAGLRTDDRVLRVDGQEISTWAQMSERIHQSPGKTLELALVRAGVPLQLRVVPRQDAASGHGLIGILPKVEYKAAGPGRAAVEAARQCWHWSAYTVTTLVQKIRKRERPDVAGPVGMVQMVSRAAHSGFEDLIYLVALLSVAVGFFNLLPVPLLDGGHAALYLWEGISRRKLTLKTLSVANSVGMVLLLSLLLFATYNDLVRIRGERAAAQTTSAPVPAPRP